MQVTVKTDTSYYLINNNHISTVPIVFDRKSYVVDVLLWVLWVEMYDRYEDLFTTWKDGNEQILWGNRQVVMIDEMKNINCSNRITFESKC